MEILLILSSKSYCFPLYNVAIPVDDSFAGYGLFLVIDDRMAKACFIFTLRNHYSIALMFAVVLNSNHYPHFSLWKKELWISISRTIRCEWKLGLNHVHFWKYTTVLLSSHAIQFLVIVLLCIWIWHSIIVPITTISLTHLSFPTKGFALDHQCASPDPTIKWVKVMKISTSMRKAIHYRSWMLIERICTNTDITAIAINPLSSYQTSSTSSQYNNNHLHVSLILE